MKKATIAILAVAILGLGTVFVLAQKAAHGGHGRMEHRWVGVFLKGLNLSDEQKNQVKQIMEESRDKIKPIFEAMKTNREKMKTATANGKFDEAEVTAIAEENGQLASKLIVEKEREKSQIFAILTDEQKKKAIELQEQFENKIKSRMEHREAKFGGPEAKELEF